MRARAPGKLMVFGEYSVLRGADALLFAVDRDVTMTASAGSAGVLRYEAPSIGDPLVVGPNLRPENPDNPAWPLVRAILEQVEPGDAVLGHSIVADVSGLMLSTADGPLKLGLGSSAASCVALTALTRILSGKPLDPARTLVQAFDAHRAFQGGRGSGADVATAALGGVIRYRLVDDRPVAETVHAALPAWRAVWTGNAANTRHFIDAVRRFQAQEPASFARLMDNMAETARVGVAAACSGDVSGVLDAVSASEMLLMQFGESANIPIVTDVHRALSSSAHAHGLVAKPSGAGGGDFSLVFGADPSSLADWARQLDVDGAQVIPLSSAAGVSVQPDSLEG